ncbi:hypothetical protein J3B02_000611 [Coemansia erecta]|nr:hypothetical protein J3B02_000611 [Coemansia erecta]
MGLLQKDKRGSKSPKAPIPVPSFWLDRIYADSLTPTISPADTPASPGRAAITDSAEKHLVDHIHKHILQLTTDPQDPDVPVTWLDQSKQLKALELQLTRLTRLSHMSPPTLSFLRSVVIPMLIECFFLPEDAAIRRQILPLIKALSAIDPTCVDNMLQANLLAFIDAQGYYRELDTFALVNHQLSALYYSRQSVCQRAHALEILAGIPQGLPVIKRFASDVLVYCANALHVALPNLRYPKQGQGSVELVSLREDCTQAIRLVFLCLSKLTADDDDDESKSSAGILDIILASMRTPLPGYVEKTIERIYSLCWDLISCDSASLNSRQVAAMVLVSLIQGTGLPPALCAAQLAQRALGINDISSDSTAELPGYLPQEEETSESRKRCMDDAVSMVCVARAIVSLVSYKVSLATLDIVVSDKTLSVSKNLHEAVFTHIASVCGRSQLAPGVKVIVFESMATWLQETARLLDKYLLGREIGDSELCVTAFELGQRILTLQRERIMGYLWSYWDDPLDAVQARVKAIFEAFLDIGLAMDKAITDQSTGGHVSQSVQQDSLGSSEFINDVLDLVLTMDWSRKVKYALLATLCMRIDALDLLTGQPDLLASCLETLAQVNMASRASTLFSAILERSANQINNAQNEEARLLLEDRFMILWTDPVVDALCKDDETSRRMLVQHLLPELFATHPRIVNSILRALISSRQIQPLVSHDIVPKSRVLVAEQRHSADACRQHALIVVLKTARSQDILTIDQLASMDAGIVQMLNHAVYHPDWSVRADMLGLICEARKLSNSLHEIEYDLLFKLLRVSSNAPSADFRQQQQGALTALATRLVTVATHAERIVSTGKPPVPSQKIRHREKAKREAAIAQGLKEGKTEDEVLRELGVLTKEEMVQQAQVTLSRVEQAVNQWLDLAVRGCLYPGAGFSKVAMGLRWLSILSSFFTPGRAAQAPDSSMVPFYVCALAPPNFEVVMGSETIMSRVSSDNQISAVTAEEVVTVLTQVLIDDPFDANRSAAYSLLTSWPLVAADSEKAVIAARAWANGLLQRAMQLVNSTRAGESESGALIVRWVFRKFVVLQGMQLKLVVPSNSNNSNKTDNEINEADDQLCYLDPGNSADSPDLAFANSLLVLIQRCKSAAERNLLDAAQRYPLHGLLTAAQYVASEIDYSSSSVQLNIERWRKWLEDLSQTAVDVCSVVLGVLTSASPEGNIPSSYREMEDKIDAIIKSSATGSADNNDAGKDTHAAVADDDINDDDAQEEVLLSGDVELDGPVGPRQQVILSYCWRAIKEVSGLFASLVIIPPGSDQTSLQTSKKDDIKHLVEEKTVSDIGSLLRTLLTSIRHRGAFSAVYPAFTDVCGRMFRSSSAQLNHQVSTWLDQCLDIATICRVSVTRRSAGWPLCLLSTLTCDKNATQALLPRAMDRLFALANDLQTEKTDKTDETIVDDTDGTTDLPQVHAINMMRVLLEDHTLASDIVPYIERAYVLSLTGLRSRRWAIRNVCSLLYAALTRRVFGHSGGKEESRYDGITGRELFTRFPGLHPFLTNQLEDAVDCLAEVANCDEILASSVAGENLVIDPETGEAVSERHSRPASTQSTADAVTTVLRSGAKFIHPALYPCLILLARLQPSPMDVSVAVAHEQEVPADSEDQKAAAVSASVSGQDPNSTLAVSDFSNGQQDQIGSDRPRSRRLSEAAKSAGVVATLPHKESAANAVAPPMNLEQETLTRVNERNSTVHVTSASALLSMYSFTELVELCIDSPVYKTREMAARAYAPLVPSDQVDSVVVALLTSLKESADTLSANSFHGVLCQVHELLRVHWRLGGSSVSENMRQSFIQHVFPRLSALWPIIVHQFSETRQAEPDEAAFENEQEQIQKDKEEQKGHRKTDMFGFDLPDIIRHKYLTIVNEYVSRGEEWVLQGISDTKFIKKTRLLFSRFRVSMLYGSLHPLLSNDSFLLLMHLGDTQTPSSYGTVLELVKLYLACVDDRTKAVVQTDGSVQLMIEGELIDEHGALAPPGGNEVLYNPGPVIRNILHCNKFYESKLLVLEWLTEHLRCERMEIFGRISIDILLPYLIVDSKSIAGDLDTFTPSTDPFVRAAAIRLLALLCTKMEIDPSTFPVPDLLVYWDDIVLQISGPRHCPLSVSIALVELQAALLHMLRQSASSAHAHSSSSTSISAMTVAQRSLAWAQQLYQWTDPERAAPYRHAVSRALVTYSTIKRYNEAGPQSQGNSSGDNIKQTVSLEDDSACEEILRLCYWRLLQDDDEDIREFMARNISRRLGYQLACDQACERLVYDFVPSTSDPFPATYARNRMDYLLSVAPSCTVQEAVDSVINPNRMLFDHENPNIYIDEPRNMQLAYYSLVRLSCIFEDSAESQALLVAGAIKCVEALDVARKMLVEARKNSSSSGGGGGGGVLSVTSISSLFSLLQSWILGARLALVAGSRTGNGRSAEVLERVEAVADAWLQCDEVQPMHPWIRRALRALIALKSHVETDGKVSQLAATKDLFLLTYL